MNAEASVETETKPKRRWNWWKIGFFVMLFLFEGAREIAVFEAADKAQPVSGGGIAGNEDFLMARGIWARLRVSGTQYLLKSRGRNT